jgi:tryptophanyl-tRNA synthetase
VNNLLTIYQAITDEPSSEIEAHFAGKGYGDLKREVADCVVTTLEPLQARYDELMNERGYLDSVLKLGREKAGAIAEATLKTAQQNMGFLAPS